MGKGGSSPSTRRIPTGLWLVELAALYAGIACIFASERALANYGRPDAPTWVASFRDSTAPWLAWFLLTPIIVSLTRRYPLEGDRWKRSAVVHAGAILALAPLQGFLNIYLGVVNSMLFDAYRPTWNELIYLPPAFFLRYCIRNPLIYGIIVGITSTVNYYRKYRDREIVAARLESQLATARLQALQAQLHPHFLFNTLNAVTALMRADIAGAERMLIRLADLLRLTLRGGESQEIPLGREIQLLDAYLGIEEIRFSDRLKVVREFEPGAEDASVPRLLLQPLVENAIRHGLAPKPGPGTLWIRARRIGETLELSVSDDGLGPPPEGIREGLGLSNTRARLAALYQDQVELSVSERPGGGTRAVVRVPWKSPPGEEGGDGGERKSGEVAP